MAFNALSNGKPVERAKLELIALFHLKDAATLKQFVTKVVTIWLLVIPGET